MARKIINLGSVPGDKNGDPAHIGGGKINDNFEEIYDIINVLNRLDIIETANGFSLVGQDLTVNADWVWFINNNEYTNPDVVEFLDIAFSASGNSRLVYIVPNATNGFTMIDGDETTGTPATPALPNGGMYVTYFVVTDSTIETPADTYNGDSLVNKENISNKTDVIAGNETSSSFYASIKGIVDWFSASKIRSILGITTLSGENTGDQDLSSYAPLASPAFTGTVTGISKSMVGLADVDNTSDLDKPVSTATQTALDLKVDKDGTKVLSDNNYSNADKDKVSYITITQAVNLDDIETRVNDLDAAVILKGTWSAAGGTFPGSGVAQAGWSYLVTADGTVDGIEFKDGDRIIAVLDNASTSVYAGNWYKADYTDRVNTVAGRTGNVVITSSDLSDFNSAVNALIATAISGKQNTLVAGTNITIDNTNPAAPVINASGGGGGETATTLGALIGSAADATPNDSDYVATSLTAGGILKKITWTNVKAFLKTYFDTLYQNALVSGTNIKTINSSSILGSGNLVLNTVPVNIKYLSQQGCISDADLSYGSSTFGTDNTSVIQGVLNTASVSNPLTIYWDGKYSVTGLLVKSYTTIVVDNGCGAILRDNSDKAILSNYNAIPVSSPGTFADNNITIIGGIWNGNGYRGGVAKQIHSNSTYGFVTGIRMYGVKDVILENLNIINTRTYACLFFTNENIIVNNMTIYQGVTTYVNQDGLDFDGYQKNIRVNGLKAKCGDDALAINTSMLKNGVDPGDYTIYLGKYGPATNIDIQNIFFDSSQMGIRLLSGNQLIDNITIRNVKGICEAYWLIIDNYLQNTAGLDDTGPGNVGKIFIENINVTNLSGTAYSGNFAKGSINCNVESLTLRNYMRNDFVVNNNPSFMIKGANTVVKLFNIENYYSFDSSTTNTISHFVIDGATVWNINISGYCERNAISNDSPLVKLTNSAHVDKLVLNEVTLLGSNNLLDNSAYLNYIRSYGIHHKATDNTTPTFKTTTTINDIVLSNYYGFNRTSGTFTTSRGDGFLDILPGTPTPPWSLLLTGLKSYWKLDEASGNAVDSSGNSYSLVNTNTASYVSGKINNGISFNGTSNYLTATLVSALPKISINVWVNLSTFSGIQMLYSNEERSSSKYGVSLYTNGSLVGNQLVFSIGNGATHVDRTIAQTLTVNTWYMVTFTFDSNALKVYVDGVQKDSATLGFTSIGSNTSNRFRLGAEAGATPLYYYSGKLDEFGIWERLLSPTEITDLYNSGSGLQHPF